MEQLESDLFLSSGLRTAYILIGILFLVQLFYHIYYYYRLSFVATQQAEDTNDLESYPPLSIIICGDNRLESIRKHLPSLLEQDYPCFEVVFVDMASNDGTKEYLESIIEERDNLYYTFTPETAQYISRRKLAHTLGVKASKYDWLVFTEVDCEPISDQWLKSMASQFSEETDIVLGYSKMVKESSWLSRFTSYDNQLLHMRFLGLALAHQPYMGIGRNMAYRKSIFYQDKTYSNQLNLQRGEDEVFINQRSTSNNTKVMIAPESIVAVDPCINFKSWKYLKGSHLLSLRRFRGVKHFVVGFETTTRFLFTASCFSLLLYSFLLFKWWVAITSFFLLVIRWFVQALVMNRAAKVLGEERRYWFSLPLINIYLPIRTFLLKLTLPKKGKGDIFKI